MTNDEAKYILSAYRPNGQDATDPVMAEALEQAARDPELAAWFREEREIDSVIGQKLKEVAVPADLKSRILLGHRMMNQARGPKWRWANLWRIAASIVILVGVFAFTVSKSPSGDAFGRYRGEMTALLAAKVTPLDFHGRSFPEVSQWLVGAGMKAPLEVSQALTSRPTMGCQILEWNGSQVTLVCFQAEDGRLAHLLVVDRAAFPQLEDLLSPQVEHEKGWTTASWTSGDRVYLLAGKGNRPELTSLL